MESTKSNIRLYRIRTAICVCVVLIVPIIAQFGNRAENVLNWLPDINPVSDRSDWGFYRRYTPSAHKQNPQVRFTCGNAFWAHDVVQMGTLRITRTFAD